MEYTKVVHESSSGVGTFPLIFPYGKYRDVYSLHVLGCANTFPWGYARTIAKIAFTKYQYQ